MPIMLVLTVYSEQGLVFKRTNFKISLDLFYRGIKDVLVASTRASQRRVIELGC